MAKSTGARRAGLKYSRSEAGRACARRYYDVNRHLCLTRSKAAELRRKYGLTIEQVDAMIERQAGLCGICTQPMVPGNDTCVDHDHATGRITGLLCRACNVGKGQLREDPLLLRAAADYLEQ